MNDSQIHRGPDEVGLHIAPGIGLGHRRLSIIDLSTGQQPLFNEDRSVVVVYNGEIYNFPELTKELTKCGHSFATHSDTEVIVHAWEQWGADCVQRFRGMFAFALWDENRQALFLARDRLGIKPLFYSQLANGQLVFGSELKALLVHPQLNRTIDPQAVEEFFAYGYVPEPKTILNDVRKLAPGHVLLVQRGSPSFSPKQYWDVPFNSVAVSTAQDAYQELVLRLREAVKIRLIAEVPLGAFLSGGVDSSSVVAMMAGVSETRINTCSISFGDADYNEAPYARRVAERYRTNHCEEAVSAEDISLVDKLAKLYDEPFADSSAIPTYRVCELARRRVTVALSGDGGDETFAGYRRYRWHTYEERIRAMLPRGMRRCAFGVLGKAYPKLDWAPRVLRAKSTLESLAQDSVEGYFHSVSIFGDPLRKRLFSKQFRKHLEGYEAKHVLLEHARRAPTDDPLSLVQYLDMKTYLVGDILTKVDRASMFHSLEVRVPILDHQLVEWASGLPPVMKLNGREGKHILKKAMEPYLDHDLLYRPKMGFSIPLARWFRGALRRRIRDTILGPVLGDTGLFDQSSLLKLLDQHQSGRRDHSTPLWALLMFEAFQRRVSDGDTR